MMATCDTCIYFRTDDDCDGPSWDWCTLGHRDDTDHLYGRPACRDYVFDDYEDDDDGS